MFCKWCGLESETTDSCSWCGKVFSAPATVAKPDTPQDQPASAPIAEAHTPQPYGAPLVAPPFGDVPGDDDLTALPLDGPFAPGPSVTPDAQPDQPSAGAIPIKGRSGLDPSTGVIPIARRPGSPEPGAPPAAPAGPTDPQAEPGRPTVSPIDQPDIARPISGPQGPIPPKTTHAPGAPGAPLPAGQRRIDLTGAPADGGGTPPSIAASGKTWYCRFCGMQSDTADLCSWCRHDLKSLPPTGGKPIHVISARGGNQPRRGGPAGAPAGPGPKSAPGATGHVRTEVRPTGATPAAAPAQSPNGAGRPAMGSFQAGKSKYYADKVFDPVSQTHYDADSGRVEDLAPTKIVTEETSDIHQLGIYSGVFAFVLLASGLAGHYLPHSYLIVLGLATFIAGILMPVFRVAPFMADDSTDLAVFLGLMLIFGPFVGAMGYGLLWIIRGDANPAVVGIFLTYLLVRIVADATTGHDLGDLFKKMLPDLDETSFAVRWMPLAGLIGWLCADPFKKPDE